MEVLVAQKWSKLIARHLGCQLSRRETRCRPNCCSIGIHSLYIPAHFQPTKYPGIPGSTCYCRSRLFVHFWAYRSTFVRICMSCTTRQRVIADQFAADLHIFNTRFRCGWFGHDWWPGGVPTSLLFLPQLMCLCSPCLCASSGCFPLLSAELTDRRS